MTAIVAWTDREAGKRYLATDSRTSTDSSVSSDGSKKIVRVGERYIAISGLPRAQQLLELAIERGVDLGDLSLLEFTEWLRALLDGDGWHSNGEESGGKQYTNFMGIIMGPDGIWDLDCCFSVVRIDDGRIAYRGSGGSDAAAALYALRDSGDLLPLERRLEIAMKCAERLGHHCGGPVQLVSVDCAP